MASQAIINCRWDVEMRGMVLTACVGVLMLCYCCFSYSLLLITAAHYRGDYQECAHVLWVVALIHTQARSQTHTLTNTYQYEHKHVCLCIHTCICNCPLHTHTTCEYVLPAESVDKTPNRSCSNLDTAFKQGTAYSHTCVFSSGGKCVPAAPRSKQPWQPASPP